MTFVTRTPEADGIGAGTADNEGKLRAYLRRVTGELLETRERLAQAQAVEPVAVVGMACRFPGGVSSPAEFWDLLERGGHVAEGAPAERGWNLDALVGAGESGADRPLGGFLHDAAEFDADFFGISPREAVAMDPQHRLLLETAWEALEDAGIAPDSLRGSRTGSYIGMISGDYGSQVAAAPDGLASFGGFFISGAGGAFASGRLAYLLGLHGPAVTVDTACSSGLVALHDACQGLRRGDCTTALVGAATVMSTPTTLIEFSRQGGLAADGRCKPFAAAADGTAFAEGAAVLVLELLSDARRLGHEVLAVVAGSAVNQDGASNGITAPNGPAQEQVIRLALEDARWTPDQVDVVEAHGTGTTLGDPVEGQALIAAYGTRRAADRPLLVGSVKSNIGHTQAAAGLAGVIKTVLSMRHGVLPESLGIDEPTPHVDWNGSGVRLVAEQSAWPATGAPRRAGVSSFSLSGTNAHVLLEQAPVDTGRDGGVEGRDGGVEPGVLVPTATATAVPWLLSAHSPEALRDQARRLLDHVGTESGASVVDIGYSLALGRARLRHRAVLIAANGEPPTAGLRALAAGEPAPELVQATAAAASGDAVFVFPGQGPQWVGMAAGLMADSPVFAARVNDCVTAFDRYLDWSLLDVMLGRPGARALDQDEVVQPALFTMMVSLAALWQACGVTPAAVVGHSQGEIAAACVAGALTLEDAARIVALRGRAIRRALTGLGGMASVARPVAEVEQLVAERWPGKLTVAAVNGPTATTVSGNLDALAELHALCEAEGRPAHRVPIDYASHSAQVELIADELPLLLGEFTPRPTVVPFYSTVTAGVVPGEQLTASYWYDNLRQPVDFHGAVRALVADGHRFFVECGAHPVLLTGLEETAREAGTPVSAVASVRRQDGGLTRFLASLGAFHAVGGSVDWRRLFEPGSARRTPLPGYAFQRRRYWLELPPRAGQVDGGGLDRVGHPLLGVSVDVAEDGGLLFAGQVSVDRQPWVADHRTGGSMLLPGTACVEMALEAARAVGAAGVEQLTLQAPLVLSEDGALALQLSVAAPGDSGRRRFTLHSRPLDSAEPWTRHAEGTLGAVPAPAHEDWGAMSVAWPPPGSREVDLDGAYARLDRQGFDYGPAFRGLRRMWRRDAEVFAEVALPEVFAESAFGLHPALFDAVLHPLFAGGPVMSGPEEHAEGAESPATDAMRIPFAWRGVSLHGRQAVSLRVRLSPRGEGEVGILVADGDGTPVLTVDNLATRPVTPEQLRAAGGAHRDALFRLDWQLRPAGAAGGVQRARWAALGDAAEAAADVTPALYDDLAALAAAIDAGAPPPDYVLATVTTPVGTDAPAAVRSVLARGLGLVQGWLADDRFARSRLVLLTRGAVRLDGEGAGDPMAAALWGLVGSAQSEHPDRFLLLDAEAGAAVQLADALDPDEPRSVVRGARSYVGRLVRQSAPGGAKLSLADGTVLVTGGLGTLGRSMARHLVLEHGARRLLLIGRRGADTPGTAAFVAELAGLGASAEAVACDVADRQALARLLAAVPAQHPVCAVFHIAGVAADEMVTTLTAEKLDRVLRPKVDAAFHLDELTRELPVTAFVLFSSLSGVLGRAGQANYAAANACLDALSQARRSRGLPSQSLDWGLWAEASAVSEGTAGAGPGRVPGVVALDEQEALDLFDFACSVDRPVLVPARFDLKALRAASAGGPPPALLRALLPVTGGGATARAGAFDDPAWSRLPAGLPPQEQQARLVGLVQQRAALVLGHEGSPAETIAADRPFKELGFDSLTAVELRNQLDAATGLRLPATLVFDFPTPLDLAEHLYAELLAAEDPRPDRRGAPTSATEAPAAANEALAVLRAELERLPREDPDRLRLLETLRELTTAQQSAPTSAATALEAVGAAELFTILDEQLGGR